MQPSRIQAVDHVNIEAPFGLDDDLRWFYLEVGGLEEVACEEADGPGLRFKSARLEVRIHVKADPKIASAARRITLAVPSLAETRERLEARSVPVERFPGLAFTDRRIGVDDPAGNRVEFKQEWPFAPL